MKKILFMLIALAISLTTTVSAQDSKKTERKEKKEQRIEANIKTVTNAFQTNSLTFVPTDMSTNTSGKIILNSYNFLKLQQNYLSVDIAYIPNGRGKLRIDTTIFDITNKEQTKTGYLMTIKVLANNQYYTITLNANSQNNLTTMSINSLQNTEVFYTGTIRPN